MGASVKIGIIICDRYRGCAGGKCFRALRQRQGAFSAYAGQDVEIVGFTSCGGCPGGNIESAPDEMKKNGAQIVHLATGFLVGYPPCPHIEHFRKMIPERFGLEVVIGTHPIPQKYCKPHRSLGTWDGPGWQELLCASLADEATRIAYD